VPWSVIQQRVYETRVDDIDELRQRQVRLGAVFRFITASRVLIL